MDNMTPDVSTQANSVPIHNGAPYFMGDHALVKFSSGEDGFGPSTYWLVDKTNHTIRPFESQKALEAAFGDNFQEALGHVVTVVPPTVDPEGGIMDGVLKDFNILSSDYAVKEDGTSKYLHFSPHQLKSRYGKPINSHGEALATEAIDGFLNLLKSKESSTGISSNFINQLRQDHHLMAFYISAMAYGGYSLSDIYSDISRRFHSENKK